MLVTSIFLFFLKARDCLVNSENNFQYNLIFLVNHDHCIRKKEKKKKKKMIKLLEKKKNQVNCHLSSNTSIIKRTKPGTQIISLGPLIAHAGGFLPPFSIRLLFLCPGAFLFSPILSMRFLRDWVRLDLGSSRVRVDSPCHYAKLELTRYKLYFIFEYNVLSKHEKIVIPEVWREIQVSFLHNKLNIVDQACTRFFITTK